MNKTIFEPPKYTYSDYKNWKEDWELLYGYPYQLLPSPSPKHSLVLINFIVQGKNSMKNNDNCNCLLFTELDWKISEDTVVRPDMMVICGETSSNYLEFPPVLVLEVLSPTNIRQDRVVKFELYKEQGVKYYIISDYLNQKTEVFELINKQYQLVQKNTFLLDENCKITFDFDEIWK
jgi:Uma2 family endonuclease